MNTHTTSMPVSAKFYARICDRIHSTISALHLPEATLVEQQTLQLVDSYLLSSDTVNITETGDLICRIIFHTLKAEIDAAIERSRRARARATLRRTLKQQPAIPSATPDATPAATPTATPISDLSDLSDNSDNHPLPSPSDPSEKSEKSERSELSESSDPSESSANIRPSFRHRYGFRMRPVSRPSRNSRSSRRFRR